MTNKRFAPSTGDLRTPGERHAHPHRVWRRPPRRLHHGPSDSARRSGVGVAGYSEVTHPDPGGVGSRVGSDPESAWQEYYATHPS